MLLTDLDELDLTGMEIDPISFAVERLSAKFGAGYRADASVGAGHPIWGWEISSDCLPDDDGYNNLIDGVPRFQYYETFITDHTVGGESNIFIIDFRGKRYTAAFADNDFAGVMHTYDLFGLSGVKLEYARLAGLRYNSDGSVYIPWGWYEAGDAFDGVTNGTAETSWPHRIWGTSAALSLSAGTTVGIEATVPPREYVNFNMSMATRTLTAPKLFYDIFLVMGIGAVTFSGFARVVVSDSTHNFLQGETGTAHWQDLSLSNYEYRKNAVLLADDGAAPMSVWGVLHMRFTSGQTFAGAIGIAASIASGFNTPMNILETIWCDELLTAAQFADYTQSLRDKYTI